MDKRGKEQLLRKESPCKGTHVPIQPHLRVGQHRSRCPAGLGNLQCCRCSERVWKRLWTTWPTFGVSPAVSRGLGWRAPEALPPLWSCFSVLLHCLISYCTSLPLHPSVYSWVSSLPGTPFLWSQIAQILNTSPAVTAFSCRNKTVQNPTVQDNAYF